MHFEWDPAKNRVNVRKHHIDFADVPEIFDAPMLTSPDLREDYWGGTLDRHRATQGSHCCHRLYRACTGNHSHHLSTKGLKT